jgi:1,4-alpha-glucan branching enzyme
MGAVPHAGGTTFRVWAPHATAVAVVGTFNGWDAAAHPLARDDRGHAETWSVEVVDAHPGDEYRFVLQTPAGERNRIDPRARRLTNSVGNGIVYDPAAFDWGDAEFHQPPWNDLVVYELHVGTFGEGLHGQPGTLDGVGRRLRYLQELGWERSS